jgi:hypothetical protein
MDDNNPDITDIVDVVREAAKLVDLIIAVEGLLSGNKIALTRATAVIEAVRYGNVQGNLRCSMAISTIGMGIFCQPKLLSTRAGFFCQLCGRCPWRFLGLQT